MLASLLILLTTVAVWTHQVVLNTDRFTNLAGKVLAEPAVIDPLSARISDQVVTALDVQARLETRLPDAIKPLAGTLTLAVGSAIEQRLQVALLNPRIQAALQRTLAVTHAGIINLLRDKPDNVTVVDGYVTIQVFPVVGAALAELQAGGVIPADITLPDLTSPDAPDVLAQRLQTALGVTLPPDFGTIQLVKADRLLAARSAVQAFDIIVVAMIILTVVLVALALWLARDRRRMVVYLGIGRDRRLPCWRAWPMNAVDERRSPAGSPTATSRVPLQTILASALEDLRGVTVLIIDRGRDRRHRRVPVGPAEVGRGDDLVRERHGRARRVGGRCRGERRVPASVAGRAPDRATRRADGPREPLLAVERYGLGDRRVHRRLDGSSAWRSRCSGAALVIGFLLVLRAIHGGSRATTAAEDLVAEGTVTAHLRRLRARRRPQSRAPTFDSGGGRARPRLSPGGCRRRRNRRRPPQAPASEGPGARRQGRPPRRLPRSRESQGPPPKPRGAAAAQAAAPSRRPPEQPTADRPRADRSADAASGRNRGLAQLLDADSRGLARGLAGLQTGGIDRQEVHRHVVLEVQRHERKPGSKRGVDPDRDLDLPAARNDPDKIAVCEAVGRRHPPDSMSRRSPRRSGDVYPVGLDARVVGIKTPARGQTDRKSSIELVDRRVVVHCHERNAVARDRILPEA